MSYGNLNYYWLYKHFVGIPVLFAVAKYLSLWQYTEIGDFREDLEWTLDLDPETCWRASDFEYGAKVRIGLGYTDTSITKVNRIEILTHKSER